MYLYSYDGPVYEFGRLVCEHYKAKTQAETESKARNNLAYRYKKKVGYLPTAKVSLPGRLVIMED